MATRRSYKGLKTKKFYGAGASMGWGIGPYPARARPYGKSPPRLSSFKGPFPPRLFGSAARTKYAARRRMLGNKVMIRKGAPGSSGWRKRRRNAKGQFA